MKHLFNLVSITLKQYVHIFTAQDKINMYSQKIDGHHTRTPLMLDFTNS